MSTPQLDEPALRRELGRLAPEVDEADGRSSVRARTARARRRRAVARGVLASAFVAVAAAGTVALVREHDGGAGGVAAGSASGDTTSPSTVASSSPPATSGTGGEMGAAVEVSVEPAIVGPLRVTVSPVTAAPNAWLAHELTLTNEGDDDVEVGLQPEATVVEGGDGPVLLAADDGCGYGAGGDGRAVPGCRLVAPSTVVLAPGAAHVATIALWRDLPGFGELAPGRYAVERSIEVTPSSSGVAVRGTVTLTYDVTA